ncbi:MAG: PD-(D/E)XK nuclease family protein [Planctomycetes bacterium]|nr:PD-(D/E)XK nuclease family protein [Planctomycetota bacterium]
MSERSVTTYTMWSLFRNCRKAAQWRYVLDLVPLERDRNLAFGSLAHECLEIWHRTRDLAAALDHVDRACANRAQHEEQRKTWHLATAMLRGYAARYATEPFEVVALEKKFEGEIVNPATGAASRSFVLQGKVDGIVRIGNDHFLLEHKTASVLDSSYLERLWTDFQITLYAYYVEQALGIKIAGVLYNVLVKARLQQSAGETEMEFEARRAELIAKSKSGKSSAQRRMPESDADFQARLAEKYAEPAMFHRETLYLSREQFDTLRAELWELTQAYLDARRRGVFYQNTSYCFQYGRPCPYFALCRSGGSTNVIENFYEKVPPHQELAAAETAESVPF